MFDNLRRFFDSRKIKKLIERSTNIIYTEESDLINYLERELITRKKPIDILYGYIAIRFAAELKFPLDKYTVDKAIDEYYHYTRLAFDTDDGYESVVDYLKSQADMTLLKAEINYACQDSSIKDCDNYELNAVLYRAAKVNKGPISLEKRKQIETIVEEMRKNRTEREQLET